MNWQRTTTARGIRRGLAVFTLVALSGCNAAASPSSAVPTATGGSPTPTPGFSVSPSAALPSTAPTHGTSPTPKPPLTLLGPLPTTALDPAKAVALHAVLEDAVGRGAPDAIAAVITPDGTWSGAAGVAGPNERKATADDEFAIASITKTFTAALVLRLAEQGKIDLDAPLASYLGDLHVDTNGATVRQALEMRAGLADFTPDAADHIHVDAAHIWTTEELLGEFGPPVAAAGEAYLYSSVSYELLALAAAHVTGKSYASALRAELLDPWHLDRILGQGPERATPKPWAVPIDRYLGAWTPADVGVGGSILCISSATYAPGAGSIASDAQSLAQWMWHLFAGDILSDETLDLMAPRGQGYAYGLEMAPYGAGSVGAAGGKTGYGSQFTFFPQSRAVIVIFVNDPEFIVEPTVSALLKTATS